MSPQIPADWPLELRWLTKAEPFPGTLTHQNTPPPPADKAFQTLPNVTVPVVSHRALAGYFGGACGIPKRVNHVKVRSCVQCAPAESGVHQAFVTTVTVIASIDDMTEASLGFGGLCVWDRQNHARRPFVECMLS